jgi:hypothetical protein
MAMPPITQNTDTHNEHVPESHPPAPAIMQITPIAISKKPILLMLVSPFYRLRGLYPVKANGIHRLVHLFLDNLTELFFRDILSAYPLAIDFYHAYYL